VRNVTGQRPDAAKKRRQRAGARERMAWRKKLCVGRQRVGGSGRSAEDWQEGAAWSEFVWSVGGCARQRDGDWGRRQPVTDRWANAAQSGFGANGSDRAGGSGPLRNKDLYFLKPISNQRRSQ
jgi:hypothetical protein